jgi:hypothetical protein
MGKVNQMSMEMMGLTVAKMVSGEFTAEQAIAALTAAGMDPDNARTALSEIAAVYGAVE